ncbi:MAG: gluconeogenesis factor YvcK family protein [Chloroflexota bacterium]|nr:gluconeogenesis factor YvcK family protein [Chloroflexota bacterium]
MAEQRPKIVVIGGGTGCPAVIRGLKHHPVDLTAIVTTMDNGGSSGRLRQEFSAPAVGDIRRALVALATEEVLGEFCEYRFRGKTPLKGHTLGNLTLLANSLKHGGLEEAIDRVGNLLGVSGVVLPVTFDCVDLCALLEDGRTLMGETSIDLRGSSSVAIEQIFLSAAASSNPRAIDALIQADAIVLGPGDLYTSLIPNLLVSGIASAIQASDAKRIFVGNLATKLGETEGYKLSDFLYEVLRYSGLTDLLDAVIVDDGYVTGNSIRGSLGVVTDDDVCQKLTRQILRCNVAQYDKPWLHDPVQTAGAIMGAVNG